MWKKLGVLIIALISTVSVSYVVNNEMNAASSSMHLPANAHGRIQLQKGDRFISDTNAMEWMILGKKSYTNYNSTNCTVTNTTDCSNTGLTSYLAFSDKSVGKTKIGLISSDFLVPAASMPDLKLANYSKTQLASKMVALNMSMSNIDKEIINPRSYEDIKAKIRFSYSSGATPGSPIERERLFKSAMSTTSEAGANFFIMSFDEMDGTLPAEYKFSESYWTSTSYHDSNGYKYTQFAFSETGAIDATRNNATDATERAIRPSAYFNSEKIAFGVSQGTGSGDLTGITSFQLPESYSSLYDESRSNEILKIRYIDDTLKTSTLFNHIENSDGDIITKASNDCSGLTCKVFLDASAVAGSNVQGTYTVSALIFNQVGDFLYYKPIESAKGAGKYELDISNLPVGDYQIAIVNEAYDSTKMTPAASSGLSQKIPLKIVEPLKDLTLTPIHGSNSRDYYVTGPSGNVKNGDRVASISTKDGLGGEIINGVFENEITFKLQPSQDNNHINDYQQFNIPYVNGKPELDGNLPYVDVKPTSASYLKAGIYKYRIQAYDKNGSPTSAQLNDGTLITGISPNQGLITPDITMAIYPNDDQLDFVQEKNLTSNVLYTKAELDVLATGTPLGKLTFSDGSGSIDDANIDELHGDGYNITSVKLVEQGTTKELTELEAMNPTSANLNEIQIKKKSGANFSSDIRFDILVTFGNNGTDTAILRKGNQKFEVPAGLSFVDPDTSTFINPNEYQYTYDPGNTNEFILKATDNATANIPNTNVTYCILDTNKACTPTSSIITFVSGASSGTQKVQVSAPGTTDKTINVRAMIKDSNGNLVMASDLEVTIHPAKQALTWEGSNIQTTGNNIIKDLVKHNTWNLKLKYDKDPTANNAHTSAEIISGVNVADTVITLRDDVISGVSPTITYTYQYGGGLQDDNKVEIINNQLVISGELHGNVTITASAAAVGDYHESKDDDTSTPSVNEDEKAYLVLSVSSKAKVKFTPSYTGNLSVTGDEAKGIVGLGEVSIDPVIETGYTLAIGTVKQLDKVATDLAGSDVYIPFNANNFILKTEGNPAKQILYVDSSLPLPPGKYIVEVTGKKGSDEATSKEITIIVEEAEMDATKIKWVQKDKVTDSYKPVSPVPGQIDKVTKINTGTQEKIYTHVNGVDGTFYVNMENKNDTLLDGATITYSLSTDSTTGVITVGSNGLVTIKRASKTTDVVYVLATISKTGYNDLEVKLPIKINKGTSDFTFVDQLGTPYSIFKQPVNDGDPYQYSPLLDPNSTQSPKEAYSFVKDKKLDVITADAPANTAVKISIVDKGASKGNDVLTFDDNDAYVQDNADTATKVCEISAADYAINRTSGCLVQIQHALNKYQGTGSDLGKIIIVAEIAESDNYKAKRLEMPVNIMPAKQTDFDFLDSSLPLDSTTGFTAVTPTFTSPNSSTGVIELIVDDPNGNAADGTVIRLGVPSSNTNYLDGIDTIEYNLLVPKNGPDDEKVLTIYAVKHGDRDHYESDVKQQEWIIAREGTSRLKTSIYSYEYASDPDTIFRKTITYGDAYFKVVGSTPTDNDDPANLPTYTYTIDTASTDYIETYGSDGDKFKPLKVGSGNQIIVIVTRKQSGQSDITSRIPITIAKRPVKLKVDDITKKSGMSVSNSEYQFTANSENFIASDLADIDIEFHCQNSNAIDVSTLSDGVRMKHDQLPITATIKNKVPTKDVLANYVITYLDGTTSGVEQGKLIVNEEESMSSWYKIIPGKINAVTDTALGINGWYNGPVDIELLPISGSYDQISLEDKVGTWSTTLVTISNEGANKHNIYFRKGTNPEVGAITKAKEETIKIDTVAPEIIDIKATLTHTDGFSKFINAVTFGVFMKPGEEVTIDTKDVQANPAIDVSTTNTITDGITYNVYTLDENGNRDVQTVTAGSLDTNASGVGVFNLANPNVYEVCAIVQDQATNSSLEKCEKLLVKKINVDGDGDGTDDYLDPDEDGCPDIDIVLTDKEGDFYKINVDRDKDNIPDMNIDSQGLTPGSPPDGIADINVDTDNDGKPDINLVILNKWTPAVCVTDQSEEYCTMLNIKPEINVDIDNDGIPDINIDTNGDFKADFNITKPGESTPYLNIGKVHEKWEPNKNDCVKDKFTFDTAVDGKPLVNVDTDNDGRPDINIDTDNDGKPNINIDINNDGIPELDIDGNGDGIPDFNLDADANGNPTKNIITITVWTPDKDGSKDGVDFDTMGSLELKDTLTDDDFGIQIQKPGGGFLPNFSIKVDNVKDTISKEDKGKIEVFVKEDTEIKDIYDVKLSDGTSMIQPDGSVKVRIPLRNDLKNAGSIKVIIEQKDGTYKEISVTSEDGYIEYETDFLGKVGIIADKIDEENPLPDPDPIPEPKPEPNPEPTPEPKPDTSVKGSYVTNVGGANTGDSTEYYGYVALLGLSIVSLLSMIYKKHVSK